MNNERKLAVLDNMTLINMYESHEKMKINLQTKKNFEILW